MTKPTWAESVEKARRAMFKDLEGRMDVAAASLEQVEFGSKDSTSKTLARFAGDVGIGLKHLSRYRQVYVWLDWVAGVRPGPSIAYAAVLAAKWTGYWTSGPEFLRHIEQNEPPTFQKEGFEPFTPRSWTEDAVRIAAGLEPRRATLVEIKVEAGEQISEDELLAAEVGDEFALAVETAEEIKSPKHSRKARNAAHEADEKISEHHDENVLREIEIHGIDADEALVQELIVRMDEEALPGRLTERAERLLKALQRVPRWMEKYGHLRRAADAETEGELLHLRLTQLRGEIEIAFDRALGTESIQEGFEELLRNNK